MSHPFSPLNAIPLQAGSTYAHPPRLPAVVHLDDPAVDVMTDLSQYWAVTTTPQTPIDLALERMKHVGVRMLLVTDEAQRISGLITAKDIQGEKPIRLSEAEGVARAAIQVGQIMTPLEQITVMEWQAVRRAQVGDILQTLHQQERQHGLVAEATDSGGQRIRGIFSTTQIAKQLGEPIAEEIPTAHSLADIVRKAAG